MRKACWSYCRVNCYLSTQFIRKSKILLTPLLNWYTRAEKASPVQRKSTSPMCSVWFFFKKKHYNLHISSLPQKPCVVLMAAVYFRDKSVPVWNVRRSTLHVIAMSHLNQNEQDKALNSSNIMLSRVWVQAVWIKTTATKDTSRQCLVHLYSPYSSNWHCMWPPVHLAMQLPLLAEVL